MATGEYLHLKPILTVVGEKQEVSKLHTVVPTKAELAASKIDGAGAFKGHFFLVEGVAAIHRPELHLAGRMPLEDLSKQ